MDVDGSTCGVCGSGMRVCTCPTVNGAACLVDDGPLLRVVAAACRVNGFIYAIKPPARHHNVLHFIRNKRIFVGVGDLEQGFLVSDGTFVNRRRARDIAVDAGQMKAGGQTHSADLFSEDLW